MSPTKNYDILNQTHKVADLIAAQEEVKIYKLAEHQIQVHPLIQELITSIKLKQQELVNAKAIKKPNYVSQIEMQLDQLNEKLHEIPLVYQYQHYQKDLNLYLHSILQLLKNELGKTITLDEE